MLALVLTAIPVQGIIFLLLLVPWVPSTWIGPTLLFSGIVFLVGAGILIANRSLRMWFYSLVLGFSIGCSCLILATLALLSQIPVPFLGNAMYAACAAVMAVGFTIAWFWPTKKKNTQLGLITTSSKSARFHKPSLGVQLLQRKSEMVLAVELKEIPHDFAFTEDGRYRLSEMVERFHSIIRSLSSIPFALRIQRIQWNTRVLFLTWSKDEALLEHQRTVLYDALSNNLPGFKFKPLDSFTGISLGAKDKGSAAIINGVLLPIEDETQRKDTLEAMTGVLQDLENGVFQVFIEPTEMSKSKLRSLESRYKQESERSMTTISTEKSSWLHGTQQESKTIVNLEAKQRAEKLERQFKRLSTRHLCKTTVAVLSWGAAITTADLDARRIAGALVGALRPDSNEEEFHIEYKRKDRDITRLLQGLPVGDSTTLTAGEAAGYLILSRRDVGIRVTKREKFSSGTRDASEKTNSNESKSHLIASMAPSNVKWLRRSPDLYLGNAIDEAGKLLPNVHVKTDVRWLNMHLGVFGNTRSGKSTSVMSIIGQAITLGVNPLVLVPSKGYEWRMLLDVFPDIRIFTPGRSDVAPFVINIWDPPLGVRILKWIGRVVQVLTLWLPNNDVISMHLQDVIYSVYRNCGWDLDTNTKGRPILLEDLVDAVREFGKSLDYGDEVNSNLFGALVARVKSVLRKPSLVKMYNTAAGITISELLAHPTIIEMDALSENDKIMLMGILAAGVSEYKLANPSKKVTNLLVLEEAHYLLSRTDISGEANSSIRLQAVSAFIEMLSVLGGTGLGIVLIDQSPGTLVPRVIKIIVNLLIHALSDEDDRRIVGKHSRCTESQIEHIGGMQVGEAVVYLQHEGEPKNISVFPLEKFIHDKLPERPINEDIVRSHMNRLFEVCPELRASKPLPDGIMERFTVKKTKKGRLPSDILAREYKEPISKVVQSLEFEKFCRENLKKKNIRALVALFRTISKKYGDDNCVSNLYVLELAAKNKVTDENRSVFMAVGKAIGKEWGK